jgi:S1-C subfamily serine protease
LGIVGLDLTKPVLQLMPDLRRPEGVIVAAKQASVPYSGPPLDTGDVIYSVNHHLVNNVSELRQVLGGMKAGEPVVLLIERDGHLMYLPLELD